VFTPQWPVSPARARAVIKTAARNRQREHASPELRGLRVDDDVPAEQNAADDLPGMRGRIVRADGGGLGHTRTVKETALVRLPDTPGFATLFTMITGRWRRLPVRGSVGRAPLGPSRVQEPTSTRETSQLAPAGHQPLGA
jgi:hypothetical protein